MDSDFLKLTGYFDERQRTGGRFLADELMGLYERDRIASSILLRGVGGFGPRRILRTDRSLSLSEDPPVVLTAVDSRPRIERLLESVRAIDKRGLFTLERAHLLAAGDEPAGPAEQHPDASKLTVYLGRKQRVDGTSAHVAICALMHRRGLAGASVFLGVDGTVRGQRQRARFFGRNTAVPTMIVVVGDSAALAATLPEVARAVPDALLTVERVQVCKRDGVTLAAPHALPGADERGLPLWQKLTVYTSAAARHGGEPIHRALARRLHRRPTARGATALRGIWGFHGDHRPHGDRLLALTRRVPVATIIIDTPAGIAESFAVVDELTAVDGLVTSEMVPALVTDGPHGRQIAGHRY
ncbi:DUF190 domain-containing protein [Mycolicibacillus parakoreensis]|uniref:DUF190 domain-containing protein n=1 Tax=Mycolicibacillus parakoreensis TaxID=1069221 RepID=A0ABY3TXV4_9MYCO|nr:DUF190 domain-containing protein [Mycolicibacillus parakoreensis]MCV7315874.1 DUF190 domain-containing protein [Mycolicibacillus parakoreensis]ULN51709.1 DUF190 domain-containing protein [Mycolicibacillus parakoreensis]